MKIDFLFSLGASVPNYRYETAIKLSNTLDIWHLESTSDSVNFPCKVIDKPNCRKFDRESMI